MKVCTFPVDKRNLLCPANLTVDTYKLNERAGVCNSVSQLFNCSCEGYVVKVLVISCDRQL